MSVVKSRARRAALTLPPLLLLLGGAALLSRRPPKPSPPVRWSDPDTWQGRPPAAGADVDIPPGRTVLLDVSPPPLAHLHVRGALVFADRDLRLSASAVDVSGRLEVGTPAAPFRHRATVTLTAGPDAPEDKGLSVTGDLEIHGAPRGRDWTRLARTAPAGARRLVLADAPGWRAGDRIVVAPTGFDDRQAETGTVETADGHRVTLAAPLRYAHFGRVTDGVDERAEVGLLTRGVVVQGDAASARDGHGGQVMVMRPGTAHIENAEFRRMGQAGRRGRYPIHFHLAGDLPGAYVRGCSLHQCYNRALTLHGTDDVRVTDNVAYDVIGHAFFLEDGVERGNVLEHNLGVLTRRAAPDRALLPSDLTPATFWVTNPDNVLRGNVAAGSDGDGFWYDLPAHPTGLSDTPEDRRRVRPRRTALGVFSGNVAHSNDNDGLVVDNGPNPPGVTGAPNYDPPRRAVFADMTCYKNRRRGLWLRGSRLVVTGARVADNGIGLTFAASRSWVQDSLFVGETANGRGLPKPAEPHSPRIGFEFYDGLVGVKDVTFANFRPSAVRGAGGLGYLRGTPFFVDPRNWVAGARFVNARPVFLPPLATPTDPRTAPRAGADGYRSAAFVDRDGSVTGRAGAAVTVDDPFLRDSRSVRHPDWGASVSGAPLGRLFVDDRDGRPANVGPVTVTRLDGAHPAQTLWGIPADAGPNVSFQTTLMTGHRYALRFHGPPPSRLRLTLRLCRPGDWVGIALSNRGTVAPLRLVARPGRGGVRAVATVTSPPPTLPAHEGAAR